MYDYLIFIIPIAIITLLFVGIYLLRGGASQSNVLSDLLARQYGPRKGRVVFWIIIALFLIGFLGVPAGCRSCAQHTATEMR